MTLAEDPPETMNELKPFMAAHGNPRLSGEWVRHGSLRHSCQPPTVGADRVVPGTLLEAKTPDGQPGDLWRCGCGRLWEIAVYPWRPAWRPASRWQRIKHWTSR